MSRKRKEYDPTCPFQTITDAVRSTGLSSYHLRSGCKAGTIPHIRSGNTYLIDVAALLQRLHAEAAQAMSGNPAA